jgi:hypothetical protein
LILEVLEQRVKPGWIDLVKKERSDIVRAVELDTKAVSYLALKPAGRREEGSHRDRASSHETPSDNRQGGSIALLENVQQREAGMAGEALYAEEADEHHVLPGKVCHPRLEPYVCNIEVYFRMMSASSAE